MGEARILEVGAGPAPFRSLAVEIAVLHLSSARSALRGAISRGAAGARRPRETFFMLLFGKMQLRV